MSLRVPHYKAAALSYLEVKCTSTLFVEAEQLGDESENRPRQRRRAWTMRLRREALKTSSRPADSSCGRLRDAR